MKKNLMMTKKEFVKVVKDILLWDDFYNCYDECYIVIDDVVYSLKHCLQNAWYWRWISEKECAKILASTLEKKNSDYSRWEDAFSNFYMCQSIWVTIEDWIKVRMCDKVSRINNLLSKKETSYMPIKDGNTWEIVKDLAWEVWESIFDSRQDLAWYLLIYYIYTHKNSRCQDEKENTIE